MPNPKKLRLDKWLWAVRAYKTRSQASNACANSKVKINGTSVKASLGVEVGMTIEFKRAKQQHIFKVQKLIEKRVGASLAHACYEDLSPPPVKTDYIPGAFIDYPTREKGEGRPTKRDRRNMDKFSGKG